MTYTVRLFDIARVVLESTFSDGLRLMTTNHVVFAFHDRKESTIFCYESFFPYSFEAVKHTFPPGFTSAGRGVQYSLLMLE